MCHQLQQVVLTLGTYLEVRCATVMVGCSIHEGLREGRHFVVGTPDRIYDVIQKQHLRLDDIAMFVLDQADEMLARGFNWQIDDIFRKLPPCVQVCLCSTRMPPEIFELTAKLAPNAVTVGALARWRPALEGVRLFYIAIEREEWKLDTLCDLFETFEPGPQALIYCNTRRKVDHLVDQLARRDFAALAMHAELDHNERSLVMREFRSGASRVLISTDLPVHGIDLPQVSLVINYDLSQNMLHYLARVGRSSRFGRKRFSIDFVTNSDVRTMKDIEKFYHTQIEEMPMDIADLLGEI